jgi:hypothetical protein
VKAVSKQPLLFSGLASPRPLQKPEKITLIVKMVKGLTQAQAHAVVTGHGATPEGLGSHAGLAHHRGAGSSSGRDLPKE